MLNANHLIKSQRLKQSVRNAAAFEGRRSTAGSVWRCEQCKTPLNMDYCKGRNEFPPKLCAKCSITKITENFNQKLTPNDHE